MSAENYLYPNEAVPDEVKNSPEYGDSVGRYIDSQWFGSDNRYVTHRNSIREIRQHMKGDIPIQNFYDIMGVDKDSSNLALDWAPPRTLSRFVNDVVDGFSEEISGIQAIGTDPISNMRRQVFTDRLRAAMIAKSFNQAMQENFGLDTTGGVPVADSQDEIDLHMELNYHTLSEMTAEAAINGWWDINDYPEIKKQVDEDFVIAGEGGVRVVRNGDKISYIRCVPEHTIYSIDAQNARDGRGTVYYGHVRRVPLSEIKHYASSRGIELSDDDIAAILSTSQRYIETGVGSKEKNAPNVYDDNTLFGLVVDFAYRTTNCLVFKKKINRYGGVKLIRKDSTFAADENGNYDVVRSDYDVWYEGMYVPGLGKSIGYRKMDNQARKRSNLREPLAPFIYYRLSTESIASRILPYVKQMYIVYMKLQHLVAKMRPDGYAIDISGLAEIDLLDGKTLTEMDIIQYLVQEGNLLYDGEKLDGTMNPRMPLSDLPKPQTGRLQELVSLYTHWLNMIQIDTGLNEARSAINIDANMPVATRKMALTSSLNSTKHIARGIMNVTRRVAEATLMQTQLMARNNIFSAALSNAMGAYYADAIREIAKMSNFEFMVKIKLAPSQEEKQAFDAEIGYAIKAGSLSTDDLLDIRAINDIKLARIMMKIKIQKRLKMQAEFAKINEAAEANKAARDLQGKAALIKEKANADIYVYKQKTMIEVQAKLKEAYDKLMLEQRFGNSAFNQKMALKGVDRDIALEKINLQQDRMDERSSEKSTQDSEMIAQRHDNPTKAKDFKNNSGSIEEFLE